MIHPGDVLDGYRILRLLGSGGFGAVWLCKSEALGDLRALKFIPTLDKGRHDREFQALTRYRHSASQLRSPAIMPIEHVNRREDGLFYVMPLCDGDGAADPSHPDWRPRTLTSVLEGGRSAEAWLSVEQVLACITPVLEALQLLSEAGLVHRDVKPDNILFVNGVPCLADISLLGDDAFSITRRGTPGYAAPSWYEESGGHPDMYGAATTLYSILTGNPPDKMGRSNFRWPPKGEQSLSPQARTAWLSMHAAIRRAVDERPAERFADFNLFARALTNQPVSAEAESPSADSVQGGLLSKIAHKLEHKGRSSIIAASIIGLGLLFLGLQSFKLGSEGAIQASDFYQRWNGHPERNSHTPKTSAPDITQTVKVDLGREEARAALQEFDALFADTVKTMTFPRDPFAATMEEIAAALYVYDADNAVPETTPRKPISEIKKRFLATLGALPPKPSVAGRTKALAALRSKAEQIGKQFGREEKEPLDKKILTLESDLNTDEEFRKEQGMKVLKRATRLVNSHPESWDIIQPAQNFSFAGTIN